MITGKDNIIEWFKLQGKPYFSILRKGKESSGNEVYTNKDEEGENMETAEPRLRNILGLISTGDFLIYTSDSDKTSGKGRRETYFSINRNDNQAQPAAISGHTPPGFDYETMMNKAGQIAEEKFQNLMTAERLKDAQAKVVELLKENKELGNKLQAPWNKFIDAAAPYIPQVIQGFTGVPAGAISGLPHDKEVHEHHDNQNGIGELSPEQEKEMSETVGLFCVALKARYPEKWLQIIGQLTHTLHTNPDKIDMAIKFL